MLPAVLNDVSRDSYPNTADSKPEGEQKQAQVEILPGFNTDSENIPMLAVCGRACFSDGGWLEGCQLVVGGRVCLWWRLFTIWVSPDLF